jgi:aspartate kinase
VKISVLKYGGSSVSTIDKIKAIARYLVEIEGKKIVIVSAMGTHTNDLIEKANQIGNSISSLRELDCLLTTGELQTSALMSLAINSLGTKAVSLSGQQAGIYTSGKHTKNNIDRIDSKKIKKHMDKNQIIVIAGFQGINESGDVTTFGRGGSDTTAVAIASQFNTTAQIYTDVEGIYGIDPRIYPTAKKINFISFDEMMELAQMGAKVMEPRAVELGKKYNTPIYVAKTLSENKGTLICKGEKMIEDKVISGISVNDKIINVTISANNLDINSLFKLLADNSVNVNMITYNNQNSISFTASKIDIETINRIFKKYNPIIQTNVSTICIVGIGMVSTPGTTARVINVASNNNYKISQISTSEISITLLTDSITVNEFASNLAQEFDL